MMTPQFNSGHSTALEAARSAVDQDSTAAAFHAEVTSDEFWAAVEQRRSSASVEASLQVARDYRRQRAAAAAAELRH